MTTDSAGEPNTAATSSSSGDTTAATVGFLLAGVALAAAFLDWTPAVAMYGVPGFPGAVAAGIALATLFLRRHNVVDHRITLVALLGFVGVVASAAAALVLPSLTGVAEPSAGAGVPVALLAGVAGIGATYADWIGLGHDAVVNRIRLALVATGLGVGGLFFAYLLIFTATGLLGAFVPPTWQYGFIAAVSGIGLGIVAVGYAAQQPQGLDYFDVRMPDRRGWLYVGGGLVAMFAILIIGAAAGQLLGLPSASHGIMQQAKKTPAILLPLIPLSFLAIGPSEELLNRNVVQKVLYDSYSKYGAIIVATLIFAVAHVPAYAGGATPAALFITLVRLFLVSLVLGYVYERTENVVVSTLVHGGFDAIQFGAAYLLITAGML